MFPILHRICPRLDFLEFLVFCRGLFPRVVLQHVFVLASFAYRFRQPQKVHASVATGGKNVNIKASSEIEQDSDATSLLTVAVSKEQTEVVTFPTERRHLTPSLLLGEAANAALLVLLFAYTGPLVGFGVYFALWHAWPSIVAQITYLKRHDLARRLFDTDSRGVGSVRSGDVVRYYALGGAYTLGT